MRSVTLGYGWSCIGIAYALSGNRVAAQEAVNKLRSLEPDLADKLSDFIISQKSNNIRAQQDLDSRPSLPARTELSVRNGFVQIGMTREMVLSTLGNPDDVQTTGDYSGVRETWIYYEPLPDLDGSSLRGLNPTQITLYYILTRSKRRTASLFFNDGILTSFQER